MEAIESLETPGQRFDLAASAKPIPTKTRLTSQLEGIAAAIGAERPGLRSARTIRASVRFAMAVRHALALEAVRSARGQRRDAARARSDAHARCGIAS